MALFGRAPKESKISTGREEQSSSFGKGLSSSQFGKDTPPSRPQPKITSSLSQKPSPSPQKPSPSPQKPSPSAQKPPTPSKPKTFFEEKKEWTRSEFLKKAAEKPFKGGGKLYSSWERKKIIDEAFPLRRFSTYISEGETKARLRELRRDEYRAKSGAERAKLSQLRKHLEGETGLKGKY